MKNIYIFKVGETFESTKEILGDFDEWVKARSSSKDVELITIDVLKGESLPDIESTHGVIITGSHAMVTEENQWSLDVEEWIRKAKEAEILILGICYGHQLIAKALGGKSDYNPNGKEIGTVTIHTNEKVKQDPVFKNSPTSFSANVTHYQSVLELPEGAVVLGFNEHDKHQIVRFTQNIWGVQFHPEYDSKIMTKYIKEQKQDLEKLGFKYESILENVTQTTYANSVIGEFIKFLI